MINHSNSNKYINFSAKTTIPIQKLFYILGCVLDSSVCDYYMTEKCLFYEYLKEEESESEAQKL